VIRSGPRSLPDAQASVESLSRFDRRVFERRVVDRQVFDHRGAALGFGPPPGVA
jgi:hypothetical protein